MKKIGEQIDNMFNNFNKLDKHLTTLEHNYHNNYVDEQNDALKAKIRKLEDYIHSIHNNGLEINKDDSEINSENTQILRDPYLNSNPHFSSNNQNHSNY